MTKLAGQRSPRWAFMETFRVPHFDLDEDSLVRLRVIQTPWFGIYVHRIGTPDSRPTLHDHPWNFVSIVLRGGYDEAVPPVSGGDFYAVTRHVRRVNRKRAEDFHWIDRLDRTPTWTLMLVGRRRRTWGYLDRDGTWTAFNEHPHDARFQAALARRRAS